MEYSSFALLASCKNRNPKRGVSKFHTRPMSRRFHRLVYILDTLIKKGFFPRKRKLRFVHEQISTVSIGCEH